MTGKILISTIAIAMLILTLIRGDKRTIWLTVLLTIGLLAAWIEDPTVKSVALGIYSCSALLISLNALQRSDMSKILRTSVFVTGVWALVTNLFVFMNWPYANELRLSLLVPILLYLLNVAKGLAKQKELGYMTILNSVFLLKLIR